MIADDPSGGDGIDGGLIGTTPRDDGGTQVTYNGHPLYRFAPDEAPGDTNGQGVGGVWFAVDATGNAVPASSTGAGAGRRLTGQSRRRSGRRQR